MKTLLAIMLLLSPAVSFAGWGPDPVPVVSTTDAIPLVEACTDGEYGTFVAWQQGATSSTCVLRVLHVLPTGDLDPAWPATGAVVCNVQVSRSLLGVLPDRLGGLFVWWLEGSQLFLTRMEGGAVATGWPARGRLIGIVYQANGQPCAIEDGANGVYLAWPAENAFELDPYRLLAIHLGPTNQGAGGWPNGPRAISSVHDLATMDLWPRLALAPDGGIFAAYAICSQDTSVVPNRWHLSRRTPAGLTSPGWAAEGLEFGPFDCEQMTTTLESLVDVAQDGRGGVFVVAATSVRNEGGVSWAAPTVYRRLGDGSTAPDWPEAGRQFGLYDEIMLVAHPEAGFLVHPDGRDGVIVGNVVPYDHIVDYGFSTMDQNGAWSLSSAIEGKLGGLEHVSNERGGLYVADFNPNGPTGIFTPNAFIRVSQSGPSVPWGEYHDEPFQQWYGDIGLAQTGDGGAVFFWSQTHERFGLFARRFGPNGQTTAVDERPQVARLRGLKWVRGAGIQGAVSLEPGTAGRIEVFDVLGRRLADHRLDGAGAGEQSFTIAGTAGLRSGLVVVRVSQRDWAALAKVFIAR